MSGKDPCAPAERGYPSDCDIAQGLLKRADERQEPEDGGYVWRACLPRAGAIKLLLLDVDGVLTDGSIVYSHSGTEMKAFSTRDGFGIRLLQEAGVDVGLITARTSEAVQRRAQDLNLKHVYQGVRNKIEAFTAILAVQQLQAAQVAYMGDDWLDLPLLTRVGLAVTVADAAREVKEVAHYITKRPGGRGAVRELCDLLIAALGKREELLRKYLR
jgi:3-deoxy-D-manno-octulosonate 8-phosphate phosphatase (KDO 8-P phosphatase)